MQATRLNKFIIPCKLENISIQNLKWNFKDLQLIEFDNKQDLLRKLDNFLEQVPSALSSNSQIINLDTGHIKENMYGTIQIIHSEAKSLTDKKYHIDYRPLLIGRRPIIADIDLTSDSEIIGNVMSRLHALICLNNNRFFIRDMSLNGTLVYTSNGNIKKEMVKDLRSFENTKLINEKEYQLKHNSLFQIGSTIFLLIVNEISQRINVIGIGHSGVGKTSLIKTLIKPETKIIEDLKKSTRRYSGRIKTQQEFTFDFTDVISLDEKNVPEIKEALEKSDLIYYIMDASKRDYNIDIEYMKMFVDKNSIDKIIIVLNMVDRIIISEKEEEEGNKIWDEKYNVPTELGQKYIKDKVENLLDYVKNIGIKEDQIVACSARKGYNVERVLEKTLDLYKVNIKLN